MFGRLTQGNDAEVRCTNAMTFIHPSQITSNQKVTYVSFVCDHRPLKLEQWRVRLVGGGDKWTCPFKTGSPAANLLEIKLLLNNVISDSDKGARSMILDLKDYFLASPIQTRFTNANSNTNSKIYENTTEIHFSRYHQQKQPTIKIS